MITWINLLNISVFWHQRNIHLNSKCWRVCDKGLGGLCLTLCFNYFWKRSLRPAACVVTVLCIRFFTFSRRARQPRCLGKTCAATETNRIFRRALRFINLDSDCEFLQVQRVEHQEHSGSTWLWLTTDMKTNTQTNRASILE